MPGWMGGALAGAALLTVTGMTVAEDYCGVAVFLSWLFILSVPLFLSFYPPESSKKHHKWWKLKSKESSLQLSFSSNDAITVPHGSRKTAGKLASTGTPEHQPVHKLRLL